MSTKKSRTAKRSDAIDDSDNEIECGIGACQPHWTRKFATAKFFMINFSIVSVAQSAYFTYLIGSMTTLEKRYAFESKTSGFILIADNISQIILSPLVGYLGMYFNKARIIAVGVLFVALSCFLTALPYFIYGPALHLLKDDNGPLSNVTHETFEICDTLDKETNCHDGNRIMFF